MVSNILANSRSIMDVLGFFSLLAGSILGTPKPIRNMNFCIHGESCHQRMGLWQKHFFVTMSLNRGDNPNLKFRLNKKLSAGLENHFKISTHPTFTC